MTPGIIPRLASVVAVAATIGAAALLGSQTPTEDEPAILLAAIDWILKPANNANGPSGPGGPVMVMRSLSVCETSALTDECLPPPLVDRLKPLNSSNAGIQFVPAALGSRFLELNRQRRDLAKPNQPGLIPISREDFLAIGRDPFTWWTVFHQRYPGAPGYLRFGVPAVDAEQRNALVYVEYSYGSLGGVGKIVLLTRDGTQWNVARSSQIWVS